MRIATSHAGSTPWLHSMPASSGRLGVLARRYGAFAVAMVLSLASAIPIVFVCRLPECARRQLVPEYLADFS